MSLSSNHQNLFTFDQDYLVKFRFDHMQEFRDNP